MNVIFELHSIKFIATDYILTEDNDWKTSICLHHEMRRIIAATPAPVAKVAPPPTTYAVTAETPAAPALCATANVLPTATAPIPDCIPAAIEHAATPI